jgi:hypothetical protein
MKGRRERVGEGRRRGGEGHEERGGRGKVERKRGKKRGTKH